MRMLHDFMKYFFSVVMGRQDSLSAFIEPLTMGERYLRWGTETRDMRDFRAAMEQLRLCRDRDAPMASLLLRKYACIGEIATAAVDALLIRHAKVIEEAARIENSYREDLAQVTRKIGESREYIRKLQEEGALLKAKAEEERVAGMEENARHLRALLEGGEARTEIYASYDEITADSGPFFRELDNASSLLAANELLSGPTGETMAGQLRAKLEYLQGRLDRADPTVDGKADETGAGEGA